MNVTSAVLAHFLSVVRLETRAEVARWLGLLLGLVRGDSGGFGPMKELRGVIARGGATPPGKNGRGEICPRSIALSGRCAGPLYRGSGISGGALVCRFTLRRQQLKCGAVLCFPQVKLDWPRVRMLRRWWIGCQFIHGIWTLYY